MQHVPEKLNHWLVDLVLLTRDTFLEEPQAIRFGLGPSSAPGGFGRDYRRQDRG